MFGISGIVAHNCSYYALIIMTRIPVRNYSIAAFNVVWAFLQYVGVH